MTKVPAGWRSASLGDLLTEPLVNGRSVPTRPGGFPVLRLTALKSGHVDLGELKEGAWSAAEASPYLVREGDFLVARGNGSLSLVGRGGLVGPVGAPVAFPDTLIRIRPEPGQVDRRFLALLWSSEIVRRQIESQARTTAGIYKVNQQHLRQIRLPLPPVDEQRRIVEILEDHLSRLDAASTYLRTVLERSALMRAAVLHAATEGRLTSTDFAGPSRAELLAQRRALCPPGMRRGRPEPAAPDRLVTTLDIPERWTLMSLEEVTDPVRTISYGILKPGPDIEGGVPYVRVLNMRDNRLDVANLHRTTPEIAAAYGRASIIGGDVLVSIRGTYGRVVQVPESLAGANITQDTARLAFTEGVLPEFARIYLTSPVAQRHMKRVARGVAVKGVNIADLRAMPFPVPPAEEQRRIVERAEELLSDLADAERTASSGLRRSASLRRALLDAAFSGRLTGAASDLDRVKELAGV